ncbi:MAG: hypothetical protein ACHRHE_15250 [Tepidisphaerales bacterium]
MASVLIEEPEPEMIQVRVIPNDNDKRTYRVLEVQRQPPVEQEVETRPLRESMVAQAIAEYDLWYRKWQDLREFAEVFAAMEKAKQEAHGAGAPGGDGILRRVG